MTQQEEYKHIAEWLAYQRKENARIFEEMLQEKGVNNIGGMAYSPHICEEYAAFLPQMLASSNNYL